MSGKAYKALAKQSGLRNYSHLKSGELKSLLQTNNIDVPIVERKKRSKSPKPLDAPQSPSNETFGKKLGKQTTLTDKDGNVHTFKSMYAAGKHINKGSKTIKSYNGKQYGDYLINILDSVPTIV